MTDIFDKAKRSEVMSLIRGKGNRNTELALLNLFKEHGITGWRRHQAVLGKPDFIFRATRIAVFVDGCFWHGCPDHYKHPATNQSFWEKKLETNRVRDSYVTRTLRHNGWSVIRIWECQLKKEPCVCIKRIKRVLRKRQLQNLSKEAQ